MEPLDVRDLLDSPGSSREVHLDRTFERIAVELARVPPDAPVRLDLVLESLVEGILVSGPMAGTLALTCARCLKAFDGEFRVELSELFVPGATPDDDEYPVQDGLIDLEAMVRDAVILSLPFSLLCRPDCLGLCERCGGDRNLGECSCQEEVDPRWAPLSKLDLD